MVQWNFMGEIQPAMRTENDNEHRRANLVALVVGSHPDEKAPQNRAHKEGHEKNKGGRRENRVQSR